jgi:MFS family permease
VTQKIFLQMLASKVTNIRRSLVVFASFVIHIISIGVPTCYGVFSRAYKEDGGLYEGPHSNLAVAFIGSLAASGIGLFAIPTSRLCNTYGQNVMAIYGAILTAISLILASFSTQYWQVLLTHGFLFGVACSLAFYPAITIIPQYFDKNKGMAMGIATSGSGLGGLVVSPICEFLITRYGLRNTLRIVGVGGGLIILSVSWILKPNRKEKPDIKGMKDDASDDNNSNSNHDSNNNVNSDKRKNLEESQPSVLRQPNFYLLLSATFFVSLGYFIPFFFIVPFSKYYGQSHSMGALLVGIMNASSGIGRITLGLLADFLGHINLLSLSLIQASLSCIILWPFSTTLFPMVMFSVIYGFGIGGYVCLLPTGIVQLFGQEHATAMTGFIYSAYFFGYLGGTPLAGILLDKMTFTSIDEANGGKMVVINFWPMFLLAGLSLFLAFMMVLIILIRQRKAKK